MFTETTVSEGRSPGRPLPPRHPTPFSRWRRITSRVRSAASAVLPVRGAVPEPARGDGQGRQRAGPRAGRTCCSRAHPGRGRPSPHSCPPWNTPVNTTARSSLRPTSTSRCGSSSRTPARSPAKRPSARSYLKGSRRCATSTSTTRSVKLSGTPPARWWRPRARSASWRPASASCWPRAARATRGRRGSRESVMDELDELEADIDEYDAANVCALPK